jgi:hypothetical protein
MLISPWNVRINDLLYSFLVANSPLNIPPGPESVTSPWEAVLFKESWDEDDRDDTGWSVFV